MTFSHTTTHTYQKLEHLGPTQVKVMHYLWKNGKSTVHAVHLSLNAEPGAKILAYTTILTIMRNLVRRKFLNQVHEGGRAHSFTPLIGEDEYKKLLVTAICHDFFGDDENKFIDCIRSATY